MYKCIINIPEDSIGYLLAQNEQKIINFSKTNPSDQWVLEPGRSVTLQMHIASSLHLSPTPTEGIVKFMIFLRSRGILRG